MKRHIFIRAFLIYFILLLVSVAGIEIYISKVVRDIYIGNIRTNLFAETALISDLFYARDGNEITDTCTRVRSLTGRHITIIRADGGLICDSESRRRQTAYYLSLPEIRAAGLSGQGWSIRKDEATGKESLNVASMFSSEGKPAGFVRLSLPYENVKKTLNIFRSEMDLAILAVFLLTSVLLLWQMRKIRGFVSTITDYSGAIARGLFRRRLYIENAGEFTELAHNLNEMAVALESTMKKKDEEAHQLSVILRNIPDALLIINPEGHIEIANNAARRLFMNSEIEGKPFLEIVRSPDLLALIEEAKEKRTACGAELTIDIPEEKVLAVRVSPLFYTVGEFSGTVAIFSDMTQIRRLEQMRKDFVANASHEIKTPVTAIKGFAETLLDGAIEDRKNAERFLQTIKYQSERLSRLVDDILTISDIELGSVKLVMGDVLISEIIDSAIETMLVKAAEKDIVMKKSMADEKERLTADRERLLQILLNLLDNAIKFSDGGEVVLGTETENGEGYLYVKDEGQGIPEEYIPRLGERFFRVDPSRSRQLGGTGLGLAIVKHLVMAHGWRMEFESTPGAGTTVKIFYK
jgi:two-component system phosphate regulon sensor histidine kinase PhoR